MDKRWKRGKLLRRFALALACLMAVCVFAPAGTAVQAAEITANDETVIGNGIGASVLTYAVGQKDNLRYTKNGQKLSGVTFKSSNTKIFTVTKAGKLTAKKAGTAQVRAYLNGVFLMSYTVKVRKNLKKYSTGQSGRNTGYTSYTQSGAGENPTVCVKLISAQYLGNKKLRLKYQMYNFSTWTWTVRNLKNVRVRTTDGTVLTNIKSLNVNGFTIRPDEMMTYTLTLSGNYVQNCVDLTRHQNLNWALDWYR